jgi:hypothetical protein
MEENNWMELENEKSLSESPSMRQKKEDILAFTPYNLWLMVIGIIWYIGVVNVISRLVITLLSYEAAETNKADL